MCIQRQNIQPWCFLLISIFLLVNSTPPVDEMRKDFVKVTKTTKIYEKISEISSHPVFSSLDFFNTTYQSSLNWYGKTFQRPGASGDFANDIFLITTQVPGSFVFKTDSLIDTYGYLYSPAFNLTYPLENLITKDDDSAGNRQFRINETLEANVNYYLIVTTYEPLAFGEFKLYISGPTALNLTHVSESPDVYDISRSQSSLSINHPTFILPFVRSGPHYYDIYALNASKQDKYIFTGESDMLLYGSLYYPSFDASNPFSNAVAATNVWSGTLKFRLEFMLSAGKRYFLVVTSYYAGQTGKYTFFVKDPKLIQVTRFTDVTVMNTTVTSSLTSNDRHFQRYQAPPRKYYYKVYQIAVRKSNIYEFNIASRKNLIGYVYETNFIATSPASNLGLQNPTNHVKHQFRFQMQLLSDSIYYLIVTTQQSEIFSEFTVTISGRSSVVLTSIADSSDKNTTLSSSWTRSSHRFRRLGASESDYYYRAFELTVPNAGLYSLSSMGNIRTVGYVYKNSFNASTTGKRLLTDDNQEGHNKLFQMTLVLKPTVKYYLVVTTFRHNIIGNFGVRIVGPEKATLITVDN